MSMQRISCAAVFLATGVIAGSAMAQSQINPETNSAEVVPEQQTTAKAPAPKVPDLPDTQGWTFGLADRITGGLGAGADYVNRQALVPMIRYSADTVY